MTLKQDLIAYQARWVKVEANVKEERRSASLELRWRQLNTAYAIAKDLGLFQPDPSETGVFESWAKLKENLTPFLAPIQSLQNLLIQFNNQGVIIGRVAASLLWTPRYTVDLDTVFWSTWKISPGSFLLTLVSCSNANVFPARRQDAVSRELFPSEYEAVATLANWDRPALECK